MRKVIKIPGTGTEQLGGYRADDAEGWKTGKGERLRVAAYGRVSTDNEAQLGSYRLQVEYYKEYILRHPGWELYRVFADEGITGTSMKNRVEFQRMIREALEGKFDYILTKSISRFARNTLDTIRVVRELKEQNPPVGVYFEKENIDTLDSKSEFLLTVLAALAQDESRSNSENCKWAIRKRFEQGIPRVNLKQLNGYEKGENGEWVIQQEQARAVRFIYESYVQGAPVETIREKLDGMKITHSGGSDVWNVNTISSILQNEKYMGDVLLQKYYTPDFLNHQSVRNKGALPSYYVRDHHPAIVSRELWEQAQQERKRRSERRKEGKILRPGYALTGKLYCGSCGAPYLHVTRSFRRKNGTVKVGYWACRNEVKRKAKEKEKCHAVRLAEVAVEQSLMEQFYRWKRELRQKGGDAWLEREADRVCPPAGTKNCGRTLTDEKNGRRIQILTERLRELEQTISECSEEQTETYHFCLEMKVSLERQLAQAKENALEEKENPVQDLRAERRQEYLRFREFLEGLPEDGDAGVEDGAGESDGRMLFPFAEGAGEFLVRGTVESDGTILYELSCGIQAVISGSRRTCRDFFGWRRGSEKTECVRSLEQMQGHRG